MHRRPFVATLAVGGVVAAAGCLENVMDDITTVSAAPARVTRAAVDGTGYEYRGTRERLTEETVAGETVEATNYLTEYNRPIELSLDAFGDETDAGVFGVITTPQVSIADEDLNPVGDMSHRELAERVQSHYDPLEIGGSIGDRAVETLGERLTVTSYEGRATLHDEREIDVVVDISQPDHDGDHLVIVAIYPAGELLPLADERDRIDALIGGLEHGDHVDVEIVEGGSGGDDN